MVPAIGIVPIVLDFGPRDRNEFPVFPPLGEPLAVLKFYFCGITVRFVTAGYVWLIGHKPSRVKSLVDWKVNRGVSSVVLLRDRRCRDGAASKYTVDE